MSLASTIQQPISAVREGCKGAWEEAHEAAKKASKINFKHTGASTLGRMKGPLVHSKIYEAQDSDFDVITEDVKNIKVFFGTNREAIFNPSISKFTSKDENKLHCGFVDLTVEAPFKKWSPDVNKISLCGLEDIESFSSKEGGKVLLYIHGYHNSFENAYSVSSRLKNDLKYQGPAMLYSWPSGSRFRDYDKDEEAIQCAEHHFINFLTSILKGCNELNIIAHSMGNRLLTRSLEILGRCSMDGHLLNKLNQIILAAPDVSQDFLAQKIEFFLHAKRITIYTCEKDKALRLSSKIHGGGRVGLVGWSGWKKYENFDQIRDKVVEKVTNIQVTYTATLNMSHSYLGETEPIKDDIYQLLNYNTPPEFRMRLTKAAGNLECGQYPFWKLSDKSS